MLNAGEVTSGVPQAEKAGHCSFELHYQVLCLHSVRSSLVFWEGPGAGEALH